MENNIKNESRSKSPYDIDGVPPIGKALPLALQHVFGVVISSVTMAIIVGTAAGLLGGDMVTIIQTSLLFAGISMLIQVYPIGKFGSRLPIVYGSGFTYLPTYLALAPFGLPVILGAQVVGGVVTMITGGLMKKIRKYFPPLVTGTVVFTIGLTLYPIAIDYMAGGAGSSNFGSPLNWLVAMVSLITVIICNNFGKGIVKATSILMGVIVGYIFSLVLNIVDFSVIADAAWFAFPKPLHFGIKFSVVAIVPAVIIFVLNSLQGMGDLTALTLGGLDRDITDEELSGGILGNGLTSVVSAIFGGMATSSYSEHVGMVVFNKVVSRFVIAVVAIITLLSGLVPKFGALFLTIPYPVLGGATITIFGMMTLAGIKLILEDGLSERNTFIVALAVSLGMGISAVPEALSQFPEWVTNIFGGSPFVLAAMVAFLLNIILPKKTLKEEKIEREEIKARTKN